MADRPRSLHAALEGLSRRAFSAVELTRSFLKAIESEGDALNGYITVTAEQALSQARDCDARLRRGASLRVVEGAPLAVKDLFCTQGIKTTAGSRMLERFTPAYESTVSERLWREGAVMLGKSNMDEFAMGSSNATSFFGAVTNPWRKRSDPERRLVPGGSSGGSAALVAAGLALAAVGSDTGGSIRQPASFCGVTGFKPSYGRCSRYGMVAFASSLDQAGSLTRDVEDAAIMFMAMAGHDPRDATCAKRPVPELRGLSGEKVAGLKVGVPEEYRLQGAPSLSLRMWERGASWLKEQGCLIEDVSLPHTRYALPAYYILASAEASSNLARYDGVRYGLRVAGEGVDDMYERTRREGFGAEVKRRILIGSYVLSAGYYDAYYLKAARIRALIRRDFERVFERVDCLLTPTTPGAAFPLDGGEADPVAMYMNDVLTVPASLAGLPAISVPAALDEDGLPLGLQLVGRAFDEVTVLKLAHALERAAAFPALPLAGEKRG